MTVMTEFEEFERSLPAYVTTPNGREVKRGEWIEQIIKDVLELYGPLHALIEAVKDDPRKTFSKSKILELIEEHRS